MVALNRSIISVRGLRRGDRRQRRQQAHHVLLPVHAHFAENRLELGPRSRRLYAQKRRSAFKTVATGKGACEASLRTCEPEQVAQSLLIERSCLGGVADEKNRFRLEGPEQPIARNERSDESDQRTTA